MKIDKLLIVIPKKNIFLFFLILLSNFVLIAQGNISVQYQVVMNFNDPSIPNDEYLYQLDIAGGESIYYPLTIKENTEEEEKIEIDGKEITATKNHIYNYTITYRNIDDKSQVLVKHFVDKDYILRDDIKTLDWQIQDETKMIDIYKCRKASVYNRGKLIEVWYAEDIPVSGGPSKHFGLPGLILEAQYGVIAISAKKIVPLKELKIEPPCNGIEITDAEFKEIKRTHIPASKRNVTIRQDGNSTITTTDVIEVKTIGSKKPKQ